VTGGAPPCAWAVAITGVVCMAQGVTLGRFVFTPMLPMMLDDGSVTLVQGGALATANYVGYLLGALLCLCIRPEPTRMVRAALALAVLLTLAMALPGGIAVWGLWRALAGACVAFVMVYTTAWSQQRLTELGRPRLAGLMFCGPGIGILLTSLPASAMLAAQWPARWGWLAFSALGAGMVLPVWHVLRPSAQAAAGGMDPGAHPAPAPSKLDPEAWAMAAIFGLAGFGYIIVATFLPVIARHALPGSLWVDLFWPIFGAGVILGACLVTRVGLHHDNRRLLTLLYVVQACGIGIVAAWPTVAGFALGSLCVGTPFLAITSIAMREARRLRGADATGLIGLMTVSYAMGQIAGPWLATALLERTGGFGASLGMAAMALLIGALGCVVLPRAMPAGDPATR
jgi:predicted MFS family arabinose efflux permease